MSNGIGFGLTEFYVIRGKGKISPDWLYYIVSSEKFLNQGKYSLVGTTGRRRLMKQFVETFELPLPTMEEQQQLASLFKTIETAINQTNLQVTNLKMLQRYLSNGLVNEEPVFGNLITRNNCRKATFSLIAECIENHDKNKESLTHYIGLENIEPENLKISSWGNIKDGTTFTKTFLKGDVLFGKRRSYLKKVAVANFNGVCSRDILVFRAQEKELLPELLPFYVLSEPFIKHAVNTSAGSLSPRTKWKDLAAFKLAVPDIKTQTEILEVLKQLLSTIEVLQEQKNVLERLKLKLLNEILG